MFIPSEWYKKVNEEKTPQQLAYLHYLELWVVGKQVPEFMIGTK